MDSLGSLAEGVIYPYHFVLDDKNEKVLKYANSYKRKFGKPTGGFAPLMYEGFHIIANALKKCDEDTSCIKEALYKTNHSGITGQISFDSNGDPKLPIIMKTVKNDKFIRLDTP